MLLVEEIISIKCWRTWRYQFTKILLCGIMFIILCFSTSLTISQYSRRQFFFSFFPKMLLIICHSNYTHSLSLRIAFSFENYSSISVRLASIRDIITWHGTMLKAFTICVWMQSKVLFLYCIYIVRSQNRWNGVNNEFNCSRYRLQL